MAQIFKISAYIIDHMDEYDNYDLKELLDAYRPHDLHLQHIKTTSVDIGEWDDNLLINRIDCGEEEFKKYFE